MKNYTMKLFAEANDATAENSGGGKAEKVKTTQLSVFDLAKFTEMAKTMGMTDENDNARFHNALLNRILNDYMEREVEKHGGLVIAEKTMLEVFETVKNGGTVHLDLLHPFAVRTKTEEQLKKEKEKAEAKAKREAEKKAKEEMLAKWRKCQLSFNLNY